MALVDQYGNALGRLWVPDPEDKKFPMRAVVQQAEVEQMPTHHYVFQDGWWGNQNKGTDHRGYSPVAVPQCVAYAWLHWLADVPRIHRGAAPAMPPPQLYCLSKEHDPWEGDCRDYRYEGTSVRAAAKVLQDAALIGSYHWAWNAKDIARAILILRIPVVVGTKWKSGMSKPVKRYGRSMLRLKGDDEGGHAYLVNGYSRKLKMFRIKQSWERSYGDKGNAWILEDDMDELMADHGEAVIATRVQQLAA